MLVLLAALAAVGLIAAVAAAAIGDNGGGLSLMEKDMLCLCREFNDAAFPKQAEIPDEYCAGFKTRWETMFPGVELGIGVGGLRALAFKSKSNAQHIAIAFRELLHDKTHFGLDDDYWQKYSMQPDGGFGSNLALLNFRHYLGFDYNRHASAFVDEVLSRGGGKRFPIFTGYGFGGSFAMLQTLRIESSFAITFSAPQDLQMIAHEFWHVNAYSKRIKNLALDGDDLNQIGQKRSGIECRFPTPALYHVMFPDDKTNITSRNVFSQFGFAALSHARRECFDPA